MVVLGVRTVALAVTVVPEAKQEVDRLEAMVEDAVGINLDYRMG